MEHQVSTDLKVQLAQTVESTRAEGPGSRFAIWVQGCPLRCPGCCNPEMLSFKGGQPTSISDLIQQIDAAASTPTSTKPALATSKDESHESPGIEGITLMGGEPFAHAQPLSILAQALQSKGLSVMIFSGFLLEDLRAKQDQHIDLLLRHTDILVDGPYLKDQPDDRRRWIGSANQRIHFLSDRYNESDSRWDQSDTLEIRLSGSELTVNGFPAKGAVGVWKRPKSKDR